MRDSELRTVLLREAKDYKELNNKQQETHNLTLLSYALARRGLEPLPVNNDKHCADLVAHDTTTGENFNIQLKGRLTVRSKYLGKRVWVAFPAPDHRSFLIYPHDLAHEALRTSGRWMKPGTVPHEMGDWDQGGWNVDLVRYIILNAGGVVLRVLD